MSILTSSYDPLENERLIVGALDNEGRPIAGLEFGTMVVDWYAVVPEEFYKEYLPDNLKNITLDDPVNNTYFLLYVTDTYESIKGDNTIGDGAQRIFSIQRLNMYNPSNSESYLKLDYYNSTNWVSMGYLTTDTNSNTYPGGIFSDNGIVYEQSHYPTNTYYNGSYQNILWAGLRENGHYFGGPDTQYRDKYGDRPGDPMNSPAWVIGKYNQALGQTKITKYQIRSDTEYIRRGRMSSCWKLYQSTNELNPKWQLLDVHYKDFGLSTLGENRASAINCNYGNI